VTTRRRRFHRFISVWLNILADVKMISNCPRRRVARWFVFKPKIPIWVNFGGSCNGKSWFILWPFGLFNGYRKYCMAIWYILWSFGIFSSVLVFCTKKNLATLVVSEFLFIAPRPFHEDGSCDLGFKKKWSCDF
jgi:hypothetical protein